MEHQENASAESAGDPLFSDQIRGWLDEGDRLSAEVAASPAVGPPESGRLPAALRRVWERAARHRLTVMAGIGLLPLALFTATHRAPPVAAASTVAVAAITVPPAPPSPPAVSEPSFSPAEVASPPEAPSPPAAPAPPAAPVARARAIASKPAPAHAKRHHHLRPLAHHQSTAHRPH
jgi:hypothetical protein